LTVTDGKVNVGVGVMVAVGVMVGVSVMVAVGVTVGVSVGRGVDVEEGVAVHAAAVAVMEVAIMVACISGDGPQADKRRGKSNKY